MQFEDFYKYFDGFTICYYMEEYIYNGVRCKSKCGEPKYFDI